MIHPPTDNLYKFLAISGLILFGYSTYIPMQLFLEYNRDTVQWYVAVHSYNARAQEEAQNSLDDLQCSIDSTPEKKDDKTPKVSDRCADVLAKSKQFDLATKALAVRVVS